VLDHKSLMTFATGGAAGVALTAATGGAVTGVGLAFAAVAFAASLYKESTKELNPDDARVLWALWCHKSGMTISGQGLLVAVNKERADCGVAPVTQTSLDDSLKELVRLKCIKEDGAGWRIVERIHIKVGF
jgi:hypothetical protein